MCVSRKPNVGCTFPARDVTILSLCLTLNIYTLVNLFPYVGVMVNDLLELETTNELGELVIGFIVGRAARLRQCVFFRFDG